MKPNKRLEGYDQYHSSGGNDFEGESRSFGAKNSKSDKFKKNLKNVQNQVSDENVEEEYIKGLQDEIKLLEYELKLLKDKDLEQQASFKFKIKHVISGASCCRSATLLFEIWLFLIAPIPSLVFSLSDRPEPLFFRLLPLKSIKEVIF